MLNKRLLKSIQIGSSRGDDEGLRIGAVRFLPRGVFKKDYARLNFFDVWLPSIAPSRELLTKVKNGRITSSRFFDCYRSEMKKTEPLQTIELLSELSMRTPISIGCYCQDESKCHRSVLVELIGKGADEPSATLAEFSVYTIVHPEILAAAIVKNRPLKLHEAKAWRKGRQLLDQAKRDGELMPVMFGDATNCSRLTHWGILQNIELSDDGTEYTFASVKEISGRRSPQNLTLLSTGKKIDEGFIRPYAICKTPKFLYR